MRCPWRNGCMPREFVRYVPGIETIDPHIDELLERLGHEGFQRRRIEQMGNDLWRWAIEANGGRIELASDERRGSLFRILLPAADKPSLQGKG